MYLRTIIHRKLLSAPDPIGEIIEVEDMYLDKVMADTDKKTLYDANNYDYINLLKGFETLAVHSSK
jgi:hypothetical protein